jgi:HEAT repeat protein
MSAKAVPDLIDALAATAATKRRTAAWAIGTIGPAAEAAVPALIEALDDKGAFVASQVAWALGRIGPGARPALPKLRALRDDPGLREVAKDAIGRIDKR